jgi:phage shock protein E
MNGSQEIATDVASTHRAVRLRAAGVAALVAVVLALSGLAVACGDPEPAATATMTPEQPLSQTPVGYKDVSPDELATMLESKDFVFINTHIPYEGEIEQTDLFLPFDRAAELVSELPADKQAKIVVYCRSDRMSRIAVEEWVRAGYTNLYNLDGGFEAWEAAGYELLQKPQD